MRTREIVIVGVEAQESTACSIDRLLICDKNGAAAGGE
jgi:hypothetical protein